MRQTTPDILGNIMAATLAAAPAATLVPLAAIVNDGGTQMRAGLHAETITEYEEAIRTADAWPFPPVIVFHDGARYWLADGFHRLNAAHRSGKFAEIPADVRIGTRRDAILHAAGANAAHGLRRTNADKRRAVEVLLRDEEWRQWTDGAIGKACAVDPKTVGAIRREMVASQEIPEMQTRTVQRGGQTYQQNTANIGSNRPAPANAMLAVRELEVTAREVLREVYGDNPEPFALKDMRTGARMRAGRFWLLCTQTLPANQFRLSDLVQAVTNVADQMESRRAPVVDGDRPLPEWAQSEPEPEAAPASVAQTVADVVASPAGDPWALAWEERRYDKLTARCERLAEAMLPWAAAWTDDKGRTWREVAERNPQHANSPFRQDVAAECQRRGLKVFEEALALTIRNVFGRLLATDGGTVPLPEWVEPEPEEAATRRQAIIENDRRMMAEINSRTAQPEASAAPATVVDDEPVLRQAQEPADDTRYADLRRWWVRLISLRSDLGDWAELTGRHTETLVIARELTKLLDITQGEMDAIATSDKKGL